MAASIANLVHETSTTTGSGNFTLSGASNGAQSFNSAFGTGGTDKFYYFISNQAAAEWEVGTGHLSAASTLVRDTVINSSNANAAVVFSSGTKDVTCDLPATKQGQTTATSLDFILDTDGTPLTALSLDTSGFPFMDFGAVDAAGLTYKSSAASADGPLFYSFHNSASPAANDIVGGSYFDGNNSSAVEVSYSRILASIVDATASSEDGKLALQVMSGGSLLTALTLDGAGTATALGDALVADFDMGALAFPQFRVKNSDSAGQAPSIAIYSNSASPAASDYLGGYTFFGNNSLGALKQYCDILATLVDPTAASEDSSMALRVYSGGAHLAALTLGGTATADGNPGTQFNMGSGDSCNFEVKSTFAGAGGPYISMYHDSASPAASDQVGSIAYHGRDSAANPQAYGHVTVKILDPTSGSEDSDMLFDIQSGGSTLTALTLGTTYNSVFAHTFDVGSTDYGQLVVQGSSAGAGGPALILDANSASPAASDQVGLLIFNGRDSGAAIQRYGDIQCLIDDATAASEDSHMLFRVWSAGSALTALTLGTTDAFSNYAHVFDFGSTDGPDLTLQNSSAGVNGPRLVFYQNSASPAASDILAQIFFEGLNSTATQKTYGRIYNTIVDATNATEDAKLSFEVISGGSALTALTLGTTSTPGGVFGHVLDLGSTSFAEFVIKNSDPGAGGPIFELYQNSASPAASDTVGTIKFMGSDSGAAVQTYANIAGSISSATAGSEQGILDLRVVSTGTVTTAIRLDGTALTTASAANAFIDNAASNTLKRSTSSGKYKTAISTIQSDDAIGTLSALRPVRYRSAIASDPQDKEFYGLIAEEVNEIDPQLVHFNEAGEPDGVQYDRVPVLLLAAYRELSNRLKELENAQIRH